MKIEKALKQLKKEYRSISPRAQFHENGWEELKVLLEDRNKQDWFYRPFAFRWAVVLLTLFFVSGGTVAAAAKSRPGDTFYPVKQFSEYVVTAIKERKILPVTDQIPEVTKKTEEKTTESSPSARSVKPEEKEKIKDKIEDKKEKIESAVQSEVKGKEIKKDLPAGKAGEKKEEKGNENPVGEAEQKVQDIINRLTQ